MLPAYNMERQQHIQRLIEETGIEVTSDVSDKLLLQIFLKFPHLLGEMNTIQRIINQYEFWENAKKAKEEIEAWPEWKKNYLHKW